MKPAPFAVAVPRTVEEALGVLAEHGEEARVLAGGQSLIPLMALRLASPAVLVDIGRIAELASVESDGVRIGATVTQRRVERDPRVSPLLAEAVRLIGHTSIRNRGTVLGSLCHADPAAELPSVAVALDAVIEVASVSGTRDVAASDFFRGYMTTAVEPGDVAVAVRFAPLAAGWGAAFAEVARRHGDFAMVGAAAVAGAGPEGRVEGARVVLSGVADTPFNVPGLADLLAGRAIDDAALAAAAEHARRAVDPGSDVHATAAYRRHLAGVLTARTLRSAWSRSAAGEAGAA